jgi:PKD repeat protein
VAQAQAPFKGGQTYWIDGVGVDVTAPKDTFINFTGAYTPGDPYATGTGIANALSGQGVDSLTIGQITFLMVPNYTGAEAGTINFGKTTTGGYAYMSINRPIVIKPHALLGNIVITSSTAITGTNSLVRFNGAQFITIDGEGTPGQRNVTFAIPSGSTATTIRVIDIIPFTLNGCQEITIKNSRIVGNSTAGAAAAINTAFGIYSGNVAGTAAAPVRRSQQINITNNIIDAVQNPIFIRGIETPVNSHDLGLVVKNNTLGGTIEPIAGEVQPTTFIGGGTNPAGITLVAQKNVNVEGNIIRNNLPSAGNFRAISLIFISSSLSIDTAVTINGNKIYNLRSTAATSGVGGIRIAMGTHTQPMAISITNNTIGKVMASSAGTTLATVTGYTTGIAIEDNSANAGIDIINNSIHLYGDTLNAGTFSACIAAGSNMSGGVRVANNILVNRMGRSVFSSGSTPASYIFIANHASINPYSTLRNNAYFASNTTGSFSFIGYVGGKGRQSVDIWSIASGDQFSVGRIPSFVGVDDVTLVMNNGAITTLGDAGGAFGVNKDINGNTRSATTPSVGAYEFTGNPLNANYALAGGTTYPVNGTSAWPAGAGAAGSFATLADAFTYVNTYGVIGAGNITLQFSSGYAGETTFIPHLLDYSGAGSNRMLVIKPSSGNSYTVSAPSYAAINNQFALINMIGANYVTIDGQSTAGQQNLTFSIPASITGTVKIISVASSETTPTTNITIKNCILIGSSSTTAINTAYGIYHGNFNAAAVANQSAQVAANNNFTITNNYIQAVRTGIYLRGANINTGQNKTYLINRNVIGGYVKRGDGAPLTYIGGATDQAGIYLKSISGALVDSNVIRNVDSSAAVSNGFRGIDLDGASEANGPDSNIVISRNTIYNLTTATGQYTTGIRVNLGAAQNRKIRIVNNAISKIRGVGASGSGSSSNPSGILIDGTGTITSIGMEIYHNTVNLNGTSLTGTNASAALYIGAPIQGGLKLQNNLLNNELGRSSAAAGNAYAVYVGTTLANSPFNLTAGGFLSSNAYGANGVNTTGNYIIGHGANNYQYLTGWQQAISGDLTSISFDAAFLNDSTIMPDLVFMGPLSDASLTILDVTNDIKGSARGGLTTSVGALLFTREYLPLTGGQTYEINGVNNFPTAIGTPPFSFATINKAIDYLNANGVEDMTLPASKVRLVIKSGYLGETDPFINVIKTYPRQNINRIVSLTTDAGRNDTIRTNGTYTANGSVIRFNGASYFEIDGEGTPGQRNITVMLPVAATINTLKLIDITPGEVPSKGITIKNCNLIGNSSGAATINTFAGIYTGGITATPSVPILKGNDNHRFENNFIGAVRNGIYMQGITTGAGQQDGGTVIKRNIIGGDATAPNTDYFGGVANAAGIYLNSQINVTIDSNVIKNNVGGFISARGIDLASTGGAGSIDSAINITRNTIYRITNATAAGAAYGISINLGTDSLSRILIANNMISGIVAPGTASASGFSTLSPIGIFVDATGTIRDMGMRIFYNSINLGLGTNLGTTNNGVSSTLAFGANIRGGIQLRNNILQNRLGRTSGTGSAFSIMVGYTANIFTLSDNNSYFPSAPGATNGIAVLSAQAATPVRYNTLAEYMAFTDQDSMSLNSITAFTSEEGDLSLNGFTHTVYSWGVPVAGVSTDMNGDSRSPVSPTIGADELPIGIPSDSIAPRIYNVTPPPVFPNFCNTGSSYPIIYRVFEKPNTVATDTFYYSVNGGAEQFICTTCPLTPVVNGFTRTYNIPAQAANSSIAYRLAVRDTYSPTPFRTTYPASGYDYTTTTFDQFPMTWGFDLPNTGGWYVENLLADGVTPSTSAGWNLDTYGSPINPVIPPKTGIKAAMFQSPLIPSGNISRLVSPCLDFSNMKVPTLRIWVSQNSEALSNLDLVQVRVSTGFGWGATPLAVVVRPNPTVLFPEYKQVDVCLSAFPFAGLRIGIEAISKGGSNIVLDSIVIFDDVINEPVTPATNTICAKDLLSLNIPNSSANYSYRLVNPFTGLDLGPEVIGNGGALNITAPNPNNIFSGVVDSVYAIVGFRNNLSGCTAYMDDTSKVYIKVFHGGPFITKGTPFSGVYGDGTFGTPDGSGLSDVLTYDFIPPSGLTNANYGTAWTILNTSVKTITNIPLSSAVYSVPGGGNNAKYTLTPGVADADSIFILSATIRLLPTNCDSVIKRYVKVVSAPVTTFTSASDSVCQGATIHFTNNTTFLPNTGPLTYLWEFGDNTITTTKDANKIYLAAPGMYTVKLTAFNNTGVFSSATKQIRVLARPFSAFTSGLACGADSIQFTNTATGTPTGGAVSYMWTSKLNGVTKDNSVLTNPKFSFPISDTLYDVTLRSTDTLGCLKDTTIGVFSFSKPVASFTVTDNCLGQAVSITNGTSIAPGISGRVNTFGSEWDFGNGAMGLSNNPVYTYPASGTFVIKLKATSNYGCFDTSSASITIHDKPLANFTAGVACQDKNVTINNTTTYTGSAIAVRYAWDFGDLTGSTLEDPLKTYGSLGSFNVKLVVHDTIYSCYDSISKVVEVNENPTALMAVNDGCLGTPIPFSNGSIPPAGQTMTYSWTFGDGSPASADVNPTHPYASANAAIPVSLTATTNKGCADVTYDTIAVLGAPNFTIDADSINCSTYVFTPSILGASGYIWDFGDAPPVNRNDAPQTNVYQTKGQHKVKLTVTNSVGCSGTDYHPLYYWYG